MRTFLKVVLVLPALLFAVMGFRWLVDPAGVAPEFGFVLADGIGRVLNLEILHPFFSR